MLGQLTTPELHHHEQVNLQDVEDVNDGSAKVGQALAELAKAVTSTQAAVVLLQAGLAAVGAGSGALLLLTEQRRDLRLVHAIGRIAESVHREQRFPLSAKFPLVDVVRSRQELWISNPDELAERYPDLVPDSDAWSWAVLPLFVDSIILGAVGWSFRERGLRLQPFFSSEQKACLRTLVRAGGGAMYRAGLYDAERRARADAEIGRLNLAVQLESAAEERAQIIAAQTAHNAEAEVGWRRDALMTEVSATLDSISDTTDALARVARLSLPLLGEWCAIDVLDERGHLKRAGTAQLEASTEPGVRGADRLTAGGGRRLPRALRDGKPVMIPCLANAPAGGTGLRVQELRYLRQIGLNQLMVVPLRIRGRTLGTMCFASNDTTRSYGDSDVVLGERLGRRCAASVEYSRLYATALHATQARDDLVAATSHELRTPLSHIKGFVSTLRTTDTVWEPEIRDDFLAEIEREADRLARLVENLLDMSRIDSSGVDPAARTATPPAALVESGVGLVHGSLSDHELEIQLADDLPPVWVDASQVERVIANLLDNAAKYSPPGQPIGVIGRLKGEVVSLRIEDHGLGIPPAHAERIFEPFFREPTAGYPAKPGTGLGLAICRSIIRAHDGQIWAEQRVGGGAAFVFTLPVAESPRKA